MTLPGEQETQSWYKTHLRELGEEGTVHLRKPKGVKLFVQALRYLNQEVGEKRTWGISERTLTFQVPFHVLSAYLILCRSIPTNSSYKEKFIPDYR